MCGMTTPVRMLAGALAVEIMAATLQHPQRAGAPAAALDPRAADSDALPLGPAPHMIRGRLGGGVQQACARPRLLMTPSVLAGVHQQAKPQLGEDSQPVGNTP